jgi:hypothetical protein
MRAYIIFLAKLIRSSIFASFSLVSALIIPRWIAWLVGLISVSPSCHFKFGFFWGILEVLFNMTAFVFVDGSKPCLVFNACEELRAYPVIR